MHQILSYQTAMRANHERDSREYITRRICVSFVLSVGFFTLIAGFLLGKFVSDRHHLIHQMKRERESAPIKSLELSVNTLIPVAANLTRHQNEVLHPDSNTRLWDSWKKCYTIPDTTDYDLKPVDFTSNVVYSNLRLMNKCFNELAFIITHIDDNY